MKKTVYRILRKMEKKPGKCSSRQHIVLSANSWKNAIPFLGGQLEKAAVLASKRL